MPPALRLGLGLFATSVLGVLSIHLGLPGPSARGLQRSLAREASAALAADGHDWASVRVEGQRAVLTGTAPTPRAVLEAARSAATSVGRGGPVMGGITAADVTGVAVAGQDE